MGDPVKLTAREARIVTDALEHFSAFTSQEMREQLGWTLPDQRAWASAMGKISGGKSIAIVSGRRVLEGERDA